MLEIATQCRLCSRHDRWTADTYELLDGVCATCSKCPPSPNDSLLRTCLIIAYLVLVLVEAYNLVN